jgi:hypothetical protein
LETEFQTFIRFFFSSGLDAPLLLLLQSRNPGRSSCCCSPTLRSEKILETEFQTLIRFFFSSGLDAPLLLLLQSRNPHLNFLQTCSCFLGS